MVEGTPTKIENTPTAIDESTSDTRRASTLFGDNEGLQEDIKSIKESLYTLQGQVEEISVKIAQMPLI